MRTSGILMHITSLPGPYGVGTMGAQAYDFVDFLKAAGQSFWQILPLTPTGYGDSPYQSCSAFAGNYYLIDLTALVRGGLLREEELQRIHWCDREDRADFGLLYENRLKVLRLAYGRFPGSEKFDGFCRANADWLSDFGLYMALKDRYQGKPWYEWEPGIRFRDPDAVWKARHELGEEIRFYYFLQYLFHDQWQALHRYALENGIRIIGDVPIYVPLDSVDVWTSPELFQLDKSLTPVLVAGVPPDGFTADGQLWGNPLYRWDRMAGDGYAWWIRRLRAAGSLYDTVRLDHFRGFSSYWAVPYGAPNAKDGKWLPGPGLPFIRAIQKALPDLQIIAEDLGYLTPEILKLRDASGYPGMKVLEFAFDAKEPSDYLPHNYTSNSVCYIGTHDNMTMRQWLDTADEKTRQYAWEYMNLSAEEGPVWGAIRTAFASVSQLCVVQMQDFLNLGQEARMNFPGTVSGDNWTWRMKDRSTSPELSAAIRRLTKLYGRLAIQKYANAAMPLKIGEQK